MVSIAQLRAALGDRFQWGAHLPPNFGVYYIRDHDNGWDYQFIKDSIEQEENNCGIYQFWQNNFPKEQINFQLSRDSNISDWETVPQCCGRRIARLYPNQTIIWTAPASELYDFTECDKWLTLLTQERLTP